LTTTILEHRNYLLKPNVLEHFIDYFEEHFIVTQEAVKMQVLGQYRIIGDPDHFVWLRGFSDMQTRLEGLQSFYGGPVWKKYGPAANDMMIDSDNVLLLRPLGAIADLTCGSSSEAVAAELAAGTISPDTGVIAIAAHHALPGKRDALIEQFQNQIMPIYRDEGIQVRGCFVAEMSENTFPSLPVIQNQDDLVVITAYESEASCQGQCDRTAGRIDQRISVLLNTPSDSLWLSPTLRSPIRYRRAS
jgi:hypothetical protein